MLDGSPVCTRTLAVATASQHYSSSNWSVACCCSLAAVRAAVTVWRPHMANVQPGAALHQLGHGCFWLRSLCCNYNCYSSPLLQCLLLPLEQQHCQLVLPACQVAWGNLVRSLPHLTALELASMKHYDSDWMHVMRPGPLLLAPLTALQECCFGCSPALQAR